MEGQWAVARWQPTNAVGDSLKMRDTPSLVGVVGACPLAEISLGRNAFGLQVALASSALPCRPLLLRQRPRHRAGCVADDLQRDRTSSAGRISAI